MQKTALIIFLIVFGSVLNAQDSKFSLEANYPIPIDNNFIGENYNGVVDIGMGYRIIELKPVKLGISVNAGYLVDNKEIVIDLENVDATAYFFQPRIFAEFNVSETSKFVPKVGLGYTSMRISVSNPANVEFSNTTATLDGLNLNLGIAYNFSRKLFAQIQYDFIRLNKDSDIENSNFNRNVNILKIGLGLRF